MNGCNKWATALAITNTLWVMSVIIHPFTKSILSGSKNIFFDTNLASGTVSLLIGFLVYFLFGILLSKFQTKIWLSPKFN